VSGVDYPSTFGEFQEWFSTQNACLEYLAGLRWPAGFVCPACSSPLFWRTKDSLFMCRECGRRTSVTAGTIFDRTRTPLVEWFAAAWFITSQKNGVSALGLQRVLGLKSYETAWAWMHKFRRAMVVPGRDVLSGTVEVDQSYVGGISRGKAGRSSDKIGVMVAAEMVTARKLGRIRLEPAPAEPLALVEFTKRVVASGSVVKTDGARELRRIGDLGYDHIYFTQLGSAVPAHIDLPGVHIVASLLKRWLTGTLHYGTSSDHLAFYLDEFTFRFNRRSAKSRGLLFYRLLQQAVTTGPHPLHALTIDKASSPLR
jgi:transposase-like protein